VQRPLRQRNVVERLAAAAQALAPSRRRRAQRAHGQRGVPQKLTSIGLIHHNNFVGIIRFVLLERPPV
jgi:hypothetical protein